jgi:hypothetical protein
MTDDVTLRPGGPADASVVLRLLDDATAWLVARGRTGQWGTAPASTDPQRIARADRWAVDYAHTDDALKNLIEAARKVLGQQERPGRVITLFGCGGDRDRTKRPVMGEIAGRMSDLVILTSDNPRTEEPLNIMNDILVGLRRVDTPFMAESDRRQAIATALREAEENDIVLIAGKGHEAYQIVGRVSHPFDDRLVAREVLQQLGYEANTAPQTS